MEPVNSLLLCNVRCQYKYLEMDLIDVEVKIGIKLGLPPQVKKKTRSTSTYSIESIYATLYDLTYSPIKGGNYTRKLPFSFFYLWSKS